MRRSNHETLADNMRNLIANLDNHYDKQLTCLNTILLLFAEIQHVVGRPVPSWRQLTAMGKSYTKGVTLLSNSREIRDAFSLTPNAQWRFKSLYLYPNAHRSRVGWFTPWRVKITMPKDLEAKLRRDQQQSFLLCPLEKEIEYQRFWFEEDLAADSFMYLLSSIFAIQNEKAIINWKASQDAFPVYQKAIAAWRNSDKHSDKIPEKDNSLFELPFSPSEGQCCWKAWQIVVKITHNKQCRHRRGLLAIYREMLEEVFFTGLDIEQPIQKCYLADFRSQVLGISPQPKKLKGGRWDHSEIPDCWTASRLLRYIAEYFIDNPNEMVWGEAAVALWIMIWCGQEAPDVVTRDNILSLQVKDHNSKEVTIRVRGKTVEISDGLSLLISCLSGSSRNRKRLLFPSLDPKNFERIMRKASAAVIGDKEKPVMPSAFLVFPHIYPNIRMCAAQRRAMQKGRRLLDPIAFRDQL